ncbi:H(+)/Cl(-) exchange transporter 7 [Cimex lectularius]|uniref:Chloride channel protein n=1 Tax=Cimex lectularius TaxID=79782 RepID=A0A8I6TKR8_CIMLE|nr:H(+)/Cl(-) exchange transporter 7 [Cimex lectularius]
MENSDQDPLLVSENTRRRKKSYGTSSQQEVKNFNSGNENGFKDDIKPILDEIHSLKRSSRANETVPIGSLDVLSVKYESLDYDICENRLMLDEERNKGYSYYIKKLFMKWIIFFLIGMLTALIGVCIDISIDIISTYKYSVIKNNIDHCVTEDCLHVPFFIWVGMNVGLVFVGAVLVAYIEPVAGGSGIPQVKCYLNGIKMPRLVRIKTLIVKVIGVISTVVGGLAGGKEGPMIHAGAVVAAGISQGKSTSLKSDCKILGYFREDHEKRDFVSGGAAAGVAAAFGAPVGGVLFSLEEGSSFWNQSLTWRIFFASSISTFTLNIILSAYHGRPGELAYYGLLNFGHFESLDYQLFELALFALMGVIGGILGSVYTFINYRLTVFRLRYINSQWLKVVEACLVAAVSATVGLLMIYLLNDCRPLGQDPTKFPIQMYCNDGEYNSAAAIWLQVPEASVRSLFHDPPASHKLSTLVIFMVVYLGLSIWTYGLSMSAGIFIPCLLTGAAWGRVIGILISLMLPNASWVDPGKYALVGAAAQLGGVVRMTISLTIILIEATGNINFGLPLMITLMTAKWVGEYFCEGFYDIHIQLAGVPLLAWDPPPLSSSFTANKVMSYPVVTLPPTVNVRTIVNILTSVTFNGFPIVEETKSKYHRSSGACFKSAGRLRGLILRSQLLVLLKRRIHVQQGVVPEITIKDFREEYPSYCEIKDIYIPEEEMDCKIDLTPYMNPSPYTVQHVASLPRMFRLFRALGLRHLIVVNETNEVIGMVTRKDLARYRIAKHSGQVNMEELNFSDRL